MEINIRETTDCWDYLANTRLPIFIYGMGLGAEKILSVFEQYRIVCSGFFASDDFVRGQEFKGHRVHSLSEIEEHVSDFIVVLAFAAGYEELYNRVIELSKRHEVIAPDVPVVGDGLFTYSYYLDHKEDFVKVYEMLADDKSREVYENVINFKISGKISYLDACTSSRDEIYESIISLRDGEVYIDLGAYNGDTVLEFADKCKEYGVRYKSIYAFEPNDKNYRKLKRNTEELERIEFYNACAWNKRTTLRFTKSVGRMARASDIGEVETEALTVDQTVDEQATLLKLDVEGAEKEAIEGAKAHIRCGSRVECALYHRNEDMFAIPLQLLELNPELKIYIRHHLYIPAWETNLYAVGR